MITMIKIIIIITIWYAWLHSDVNVIIWPFLRAILNQIWRDWRQIWFRIDASVDYPYSGFDRLCLPCNHIGWSYLTQRQLSIMFIMCCAAYDDDSDCVDCRRQTQTRFRLLRLARGQIQVIILLRPLFDIRLLVETDTGMHSEYARHDICGCVCRNITVETCLKGLDTRQLCTPEGL